jgi:hypothetical protein
MTISPISGSRSPFPLRKDLGLDLIHGLFDLVHADRPLVAGAQNTALDLGAVIRLAVIILLDNNQRNSLDLFIRRKTFAAGIAYTAPADRIIVVGRS